MNLLKPRSSRAALRNLLLTLAVVVGVLIYSYGWTVTSIDLEKPQEGTRQQNVTSALQELLSPRIFEQDRILLPIRAPFLMNCDTGAAPDAATAPTDGTPYILVEPACGEAGDVVSVQAINFAPNAEARIRWIPVDGQSRPREVVETGREVIVLGNTGGFTGQIEVPRISGSNGQLHEIEFVAATPDGPVRLSNTTNEVLRRMAETIFMALMATSLAIPVSAALSFLAAHNLMRPVRIPVGNLMVFVVCFPIGYLIGTSVVAIVGRLGLGLGSGDLSTVLTASLPMVFVLGLAAMPQKMSPINGSDTPDMARSILGQVLVTVVAVFFIGLLGGLGILGERFFDSVGSVIRPDEVTNLGTWLLNALGDGIGSFGRFIGILGGLVELFIAVVAGLLSAFTFASIVARFTTPLFRRTQGAVGAAIGAVLGSVSGGLVMALCAVIGTSAALFGLFPPLVAAIFGSGVSKQIYNRLTLQLRGHRRPEIYDLTLRSLLSIIVAVVAFVVTFNLLSVDRAIIDGTLPSLNTVAFLGFEMSQYVYLSIIVGMVLGFVSGALAGVQSPFMIGDVTYNITRNVLNALRSIEPLIMGLIFVIWVGIGPFAGVLALTLHSIASLGKLYSEQIETIDPGPVEALQSTGANHLQTIIYGVVPQIIPPYIAFTMYRWDINVRMSTIIGFVGGGGIGLLLSQQINLLRYRDAGVAVLAIAIVVAILDYASASIRERVM